MCPPCVELVRKAHGCEEECSSPAVKRRMQECPAQVLLILPRLSYCLLHAQQEFVMCLAPQQT